MRYLLSIIFCLWTSCAWAFPPGFIGAVTQGATSEGDSQTYDYLETFEGTEYDNTWVETLGTPDGDATPAIDGNQSLLLDAAGNLAPQELYKSYTMGTAGYRVNIRFKMRCSALPTTGSGGTLAKFTSTTPTTRGSVNLVQSSGAKLAAVAAGGTTVTTAATLSTDTTYYVWVAYKKGSGSNAKTSVAFSTTYTRPTSGDNFAESTDGTATSDPLRLYLSLWYSGTYGANGTATCKFDQFMTWEDNL